MPSKTSNIINFPISDRELFERFCYALLINSYLFNKRNSHKALITIALLLMLLSKQKPRTDIGELDPWQQTVIKTEQDLQILLHQAEGHRDIAPAEKPDLEVKPPADSTGHGLQANSAKQHPALNANQFKGINPDGNKPALPSEMTPDEINRSAAKNNLELNPTLEKRLGNEPGPAPTPATPTPNPFK